jgi:hypothetical protein
MILKRTAFWAIALSLFSSIALHPGQNPEVHVTIFVHGSIFSPLSILSMGSVINDDLSDRDLYVRTISRLRKYDILRQDQILQQEGFHPLRTLTFDFADLSCQERKAAAPHAVPAYIACANLVSQEDVDHRAYTFGHLGLLSGNYRRDAAQDFYDALCATIYELQQQHQNVKITIVTHSHGGNIALNLAYWEDQKKQGLKIDNLVMLGCPIQAETAHYAFNPLFKRVYNLYSDGDIIQNADTISSRASYRRIFDSRLKIDRTADLNVVKDVRLHVNNSKKRIDHANMWLMGLSRKACKTLDPLPIAVLVPMIVQSADQVEHERLDCNIVSTEHHICVQISSHGQQEVIVQTDNIRPHAVAWNRAVVESWAPDYTSRNVIFNFKMRKVLYNALRDWWRGKVNFVARKTA